MLRIVCRSIRFSMGPMRLPGFNSEMSAIPIQMSDVMAALDRDHANIAKLLELIESEILAIEVGKTPDYPLLQDIMRYMTHYPDRFHHPKEDLIFAQVLKREPGARDDVEDLLAEHISIGLAGQEFNRLL